MSASTGQGIFERYEAESFPLYHFKWQDVHILAQNAIELILCDGKLSEASFGKISAPCDYALTSDKLYRKNSRAGTQAPKDSSSLGFTPVYGSYLSLLLPRLSKVKLNGQYGFRLRWCSHEHTFICSSRAEMLRWHESLKKMTVLSNIASKYETGKLLGKGSYATVHMGTRLEDGKEVAIKTLRKGRLVKSKEALVGRW